MRYYFIHYMYTSKTGTTYSHTSLECDGFLNHDEATKCLFATSNGECANVNTVVICNYKELTKEEYEAFNR